MGIGVGVFQTLHRVFFEQFAAPSFVLRLSVDSANYLYSGFQMLNSGQPWKLAASWMSVGMQYECMLFISLFGVLNASKAIKILNVICFFLGLSLYGSLIKKGTKNAIFLLAVLFFTTFSTLFQSYVAIVQWEMPTAFLALLFIWLWIRNSEEGWTSHFRTSTAALVLIVLCFYRVHFILLPLILAALDYRELKAPRFRKSMLLFVIVFLAISTPINWRLSQEMDPHTFFFQAPLSFKKTLHSAAASANYPWILPSADRTSGISFIFENPFDFLKLTLSRIPYALGWKRDIWLLDSPYVKAMTTLGADLTVARCILAGVQVLLFGLGLWICFGRRDRGEALFGKSWNPARFRVWIAVPVLCFLPQFLVGASTRFLVPAIPSLVVIQMVGLAWLIKRPRNVCVINPRQTSID